MTPKTYDALVIGGGIQGLSSLYHLLRLGCRHVGLVEQFTIGHSHGSSHGASRITRSSYAHARYVKLMQVVHNEEWPRLERDANQKLIHPSVGCFWGPANGPLKGYADAIADAELGVHLIDAKAATKQFPMIRFEPTDNALIDHTCGVVAAQTTLHALHRLCAPAEFLEKTQVTQIDVNTAPIRVQTTGGELTTERLIVTAGAWSSRLVGALKPKLKVARQTVGFFEMEGDRKDYAVGAFPVWVYLGADPRDHFYGLPEFGTPGIKLARHLTREGSDSPDESPQLHPEAIKDIEAFLEQRFVPRMKKRLHAEHCLYTNTPTEDYILDHHPNNAQVAIGAGFSGHGFKLAPLCGRILAELCLHGKTSVSAFESSRREFMIQMSDF